MDESLRALDDVVRAGKARYVGCSNYLALSGRPARSGAASTLGLARFDCVQPRYNLLFRQVERELFPLCAEEGLGVIPYNPIAGGLLSGKHRREAGPMPDTRFTHPTAGAALPGSLLARARARDGRGAASAGRRGRHVDGPDGRRVGARRIPSSRRQSSAPAAPSSSTTRSPPSTKGLDGSLKARLDDLTREYRWGDDIR